MKKLGNIILATIFSLGTLTDCSTTKNTEVLKKNLINEISNKKISLLNLYWAYKESADYCLANNNLKEYNFWIENAASLRDSILSYDQAIKNFQEKLKNKNSF